jgi:hypothetical protein
VNGLNTGKQPGFVHGLLLVRHRQRIEFSTSVCLALRVLLLAKHTDLLADGNGGVLMNVQLNKRFD